MPSIILTAEEVARYLRISETTVYRQAEKGILPGFKIGRQWRFRKEELEKFIENSSSWKKRMEELLTQFQKQGKDQGITEDTISREIAAVRKLK